MGNDDLCVMLFETLLGRRPSQKELTRWSSALEGDETFGKLFKAILGSPEYVSKKGVSTAFLPGHYYSPIVDPSLVKNYVARQNAIRPEEIAEIDLNLGQMASFWIDNLPTIVQTAFTSDIADGRRFHYKNGSFPYGDAITLRAIIAHHRPSRIIEIGSGHTTACMLDVFDELKIYNTRITCIEPYPKRLKSVMRAQDYDRITIVESDVQAVDLTIFDGLSENDILFIDSTHIVKTGSDVHFEIFSILPRVKPGVIIHFHDVPFPFEYPKEWIFDFNYSWNEAYFLRAFLMHNSAYDVFFWGSMLARFHHSMIKQDFPLFLENPGSSIWIRKIR